MPQILLNFAFLPVFLWKDQERPQIPKLSKSALPQENPLKMDLVNLGRAGVYTREMGTFWPFGVFPLFYSILGFKIGHFPFKAPGLATWIAPKLGQKML